MAHFTRNNLWSKQPCTLLPHYFRSLKESPVWKRMLIKFRFEMLKNSWLCSFAAQWEISGNYDDDNNFKKIITIIFDSFGFFGFFLFWFSHNFWTKAFRSWLKKSVSSHRVYCQISSKSITFNTVIFFFLTLFWVILTPKFFSKNLKLRVRYFFGRPITYYVKNKSKIVRVILGWNSPYIL